jgi:CheY-like chemotaxis protein
MEVVASEHILVVEDDRGVRESLTDALTLEGYEVTCAENGAVALRQLSDGQRPCLILLDLMMPVMDGVAFAQALRRQPHRGSIPIVVISADGNWHKATSVGAAGFLAKPFDIDALLGHVAAMTVA